MGIGNHGVCSSHGEIYRDPSKGLQEFMDICRNTEGDIRVYITSPKPQTLSIYIYIYTEI